MSLNNQNAAEIRAARESSESFKSSVFRMQVEEVLNEITVDEKYAAQARKMLFTLRQIIAETKEVPPKSFKEAEKDLNIKVPWPKDSNANSEKLKYGYLPPSEEDINVIGSWSLHTAIRKPKRVTGIDLFVGMPSNLFDPKDFRDYRYHCKKAFYLAHLAAHLAESNLPFEIRFERFNNNQNRLGLLLVPHATKLAKRLNFHIHVGPAEQVFPANKLGPTKNAVRSIYDDMGELAPTPLYNWSVLADQNTDLLLKFLHSAAATTPAFTDAVKMGALWLEQHNYTSNRELGGGFGSFEFACLMAALLMPPHKLLTGYSSYQLFKGTLLYLAEHETISLNTGFATGSKTTDATNSGILFDNTFNVLANVAPWTYKRLHDDAVIACDLLNDSVRDRFGALFLRNIGDNKTAYDFNFEATLDSPLDCVELVNTSFNILNKAWSERYRNMVIRVTDCDEMSWSLASGTPSTAKSKFSVHFIVNPESSEKKLTFVSAEYDSIDDFKEFWGSKASLRRFQNGEIKEAVAWSANSKVSVMEECAEYALDAHMNATVEFDRDTTIARSLLPTNSQSAGFGPIITSFQKLSSVMQELRGSTPLKIYTVAATSPVLRYSSVKIPQPFQDSTTIDAMILIENSGKWPKDPEASAKVKIAFIVKIAETLRELHPEYFVVVSLEPEPDNSAIETAALTIQTPEGYYFKLHLNTFTNQSHPLVVHTQAISTLALRYPLYSVTVRLFKLWLDNQMLMPYLSEPAVELLVMNTFANSAPWSPPGSATAAFWRILDNLSRWNWQTDSLFVDLTTENVKLNGATGCGSNISIFQAAVKATELARKQDPAFTQSPWLIATNLDHQGNVWTSWEPRSRVAGLITSRITKLAVNGTKSMLPMKSLFKASTNEFDVVYTVRDPIASENKKFKNIAISDPAKAITEATSFAQDIVKALKKAYQDYLILFYDGTLTNKNTFILCGIWNQASCGVVKKPKPGFTFPLKELPEGGYTLDKAAVLAEIERISGGVLERIK